MRHDDAAAAEWSNLFYGPQLGPLIPAVYTDVEQPAPLCMDEHHPDHHHQSPTSKQWQAAMRAAGDGAILCRSREMLATASALGNQVYWYFFTATPIYSANWPAGSMPYEGAFHGSEVPFVFGDGFELSSGGERSLSAAMGCYWANFASSGNPNNGPSGCAAHLKLPSWPVLGPTGAAGKGAAIVFSNTSVTVKQGLKAQPCDLFKKYN